MKILQVILGVIIAVSVFLPWVSGEAAGWELGTDTGIDQNPGILVLIMGICCAGLSFLPNARIRVIGQLATGVIALIGVAAYWGTVRSEVGMYGQVVSVLPEFGLILCIIVAVVVIITGILQLVRKPEAE